MKQTDEHDVQMIPIDKIRVINSREHDRAKHDQIKESIATVGLKKPIEVSRRSESDGDGYDLVYGEGRLKAFIALGATEIPAIVVDISKEERLLRSLVENMARRHRNAKVSRFLVSRHSDYFAEFQKLAVADKL